MGRERGVGAAACAARAATGARRGGSPGRRLRRTVRRSAARARASAFAAAVDSGWLRYSDRAQLTSARRALSSTTFKSLPVPPLHLHQREGAWIWIECPSLDEPASRALGLGLLAAGEKLKKSRKALDTTQRANTTQGLYAYTERSTARS